MNYKRIIFFLLFSIILNNLSIEAHVFGDTIKLAQPPKKKKPYPPLQPLVLKTSVTGFLAGGSVLLLTSEYRLTAEITTGRKQSDQVSIAYLGKNVFYGAFEKLSKQSSSDILKVSGWRFQYAHKFYLVNRRHYSPYGFYVAPHFSYSNARIAWGLQRYYYNTYFDVRHLNANILIGVQVGKMGRLTMDVCAGAGYKMNVIYYHATSYRIEKFDTEDFGEYYNGPLHLMFDLSLGYSF